MNNNILANKIFSTRHVGYKINSLIVVVNVNVVVKSDYQKTHSTHKKGNPITEKHTAHTKKMNPITEKQHSLMPSTYRRESDYRKTHSTHKKDESDYRKTA